MTNSSVIDLPAVNELLVEAAEWRLLGLLFACPRGDWREQISALIAEVRDDALRIAARTAIGEATEGGYYTAFGPGGPGAPREVSHRQSDLTGQYLAELLAYYNAFAYRLPREEPPDHIATEIDFVAYLRLKQAYAVARNDETQAAVTAQTMQCFIQDHLATTAVPLMQILEASGIPYLSLAAIALSERINTYHTKTNSSSLEFDERFRGALPICAPCDCCQEVID
jgi:nitrate reductase assembly molybdenum cofactor insertion protein NarJ